MSLLLLPSSSPAPVRFRQAHTQQQLNCYQLYAVERWITSRDNHPLLLVYTGHPEHTVLVDAYTPLDQQAWDNAIAVLRAHGARPKHTPHGTLMLTSLAHFRSDYTIVNIPGGDYSAVHYQLYANINLLRMGCSGRSALTLEDPSEATKDRFLSSYHLPDTTITELPAKPNHSTTSLRKDRDKLLIGKTKDRPAFVATVLEFVKIIQAALAIFGMYPVETTSVSPNINLDGLLCDTTLQGIQKWISRVGRPSLSLEPTDRVIDPLFVSALLSLVIATRNKLAYLGYSYIIPRDPFLHPHAFSLALTTYIHSHQTTTAVHHTNQVFSTPQSTIHISAPLIPPAPPPNSFLSAAAAAAALPVGTILTPDTLNVISSLYDQKSRTESRKVRHVLKNKLVDSETPADANAIPERDYSRRHTLSLSMSLSGGEEPNPPSTTGQTGPGGSSTMGKSQLLSGIASGIRGGTAALANVGVNVGAGISATEQIAGDLGQLTTPILDLAAFVLIVAGPRQGAGKRPDTRSARAKAKRASREITAVSAGGAGAGAGGGSAGPSRRTESVDMGSPNSGGVSAGTAYTQERERAISRATGMGGAMGDNVVAASVRALWSGRVGDLVRMREEVEAMHEAGVVLGLGALGGGGGAGGMHLDGRGGTVREKRRALSPASDGEESYARAAAYDGRSTEEESDVLNPQMGGTGAFGGMWTGRVRGKLGTWAGLARKKHHSVDLGQSSPAGKEKDKDKDKDATLPHSQPLSTVSSMASSHQSQPIQPPSDPSGRPQPSRLIIGGGGAMSRRTSDAMSRPPLSRAQSPTLPPMVFSTDIDRDMEDDDLLSSGQVSPLSDYRPNPFSMLRHNHGTTTKDPTASASGASSTTNLVSTHEFDERALRGILEHKRPWRRTRMVQSARVASWAHPMSRKEDEEEDEEEEDGEECEDEDGSLRVRALASDEGEGEESDVSGMMLVGRAPRPGKKTKPKPKPRPKAARFHSLLSVVDGAGVRAEELLDASSEAEAGGYGDHDDGDDDEDEEDGGHVSFDEDGGMHRRRGVGFDPRRRRSFHDLDTFRGIETLSPERMALDVEICGELLTMWRREEHLQNVIACVQLLSNSLSQTNTSLRAHYESHTASILALDKQSSILACLDAEQTRADKIFQATNTLRYESEQFRVDDLWAAARPQRRTVLELRERVFGMGGRRLREGVHGAHGPFNRLQWTLDGRARLVDGRGRTESEADEEKVLEAISKYLDGPERAAAVQEGAEGAAAALVGEGTKEDEGAVVEHSGIKPMWLLRFFTSWGARWSAAVSAAPLPAVVTPTVISATPSASDEDAKAPPMSAPAAPTSVSPFADGKSVEKPSRSASH